MDLSIRQSYFAMFHLLSKFYKDTKDECFASLLSGFDPYLFIDSMSADPAAWDDWKNSVKNITNKETLSNYEALCATREFINFHQREFGFDLKWLVSELDSMSANSKSWLDSVNKALRER